MPLSQVAVALLYLYACLLGMALGLLYDGCRITRIFLGEHYSRRAVARLHTLRLPLIGGYRPHRARRSLCVVVFIEDFLFCLIAGVAFILLCYEAFDGRLRPMALVCMAGGFALYRRTLGRAVMLFSEVIAFGLECALRYCVWFLLFPFRWAGGRLLRLLRCTAGRMRELADRRGRAAWTGRQMQRAQQGGELLPHAGENGKDVKHAKYATGKTKKKTIQPEPDGAGFSRTADCGVAGGVHQQRDGG